MWNSCLHDSRICILHQLQGLIHLQELHQADRERFVKPKCLCIKVYQNVTASNLWQNTFMVLVPQIYIKDPYVTKFLTQEKITTMSFVGNVGGILGLFLGFSFISGAEIFALIVSIPKRCFTSPTGASATFDNRDLFCKTTFHDCCCCPCQLLLDWKSIWMVKICRCIEI